MCPLSPIYKCSYRVRFYILIQYSQFTSLYFSFEDWFDYTFMIGKICDAVEVAGKNVMSTSSTVTTGLVTHR